MIPPNIEIQGIPDIPNEVSSRIEQYLQMRSAFFVDWDPHTEGILIKTRFAETLQLHYVKMPGGGS